MLNFMLGMMLGSALAGLVAKGDDIIASVKARWTGFVKRHIVDVDPDDGKIDLHSPTRYVPEQYVDWSQIPKGYDWVAVDSPDETAFRKLIHTGLLNIDGVGAYKKEPINKGGFFDAGDNDILVKQSAITGPSLRGESRGEGGRNDVQSC